jgi:hypothetical protein
MERPRKLGTLLFGLPAVASPGVAPESGQQLDVFQKKQHAAGVGNEQHRRS